MVRKTTGTVQAILPELFKRLDAVEQGHADVGDDDVGTQRTRRIDHPLSVFDDANQFEVAGEDALESFHHDPVIVGEHDSRDASRGLLHRHPGHHRGAVIGSTDDVELTADQANPFAHAHEAEARAAIGA